MDKIAIIGGFGFIARNIVETLGSRYEFVLFDRQNDIQFAEQHNVEFECCDLLVDDICSLFNKHQPAFIINTVSIVNAARDLSLIAPMIEVNLKVLLRLYEATAELSSLKALIHLGSTEEYGPISMPFTEDMRELPMSPYALCKQITTNTAVMLYRNCGYPSIVVRPSNIYGKGQSSDKFIPYIISQIKQNNPLRLTPCQQKRDFISARSFALKLGDVIDHYGQALGQIINIGSGSSIELREIVEFTKIHYNSTSQVNYGAMSYRDGEMMDFVSSIAKLEQITKKSQSVDFWGEYKEFLQ